MMSLTVAQLQDIAHRAQSVIEESDGADEHATLLVELRALVALCTDAIGASHMGCGAHTVILELGDPDDLGIEQ